MESFALSDVSRLDRTYTLKTAPKPGKEPSMRTDRRHLAQIVTSCGRRHKNDKLTPPKTSTFATVCPKRKRRVLKLAEQPRSLARRCRKKALYNDQG